MAKRTWGRVPYITRNNGYRYVWEPDHPLATKDGYVGIHRKVVYDAGIPVPPGAHVHHVNEDKTDNRLENLVVKSPSDHHREHVEAAGFVVNQFGTFPVKPRDQRASAPRPVRPCRQCGQQIPLSRRRDALYCSRACCRSAEVRTRRERRSAG